GRLPARVAPRAPHLGRRRRGAVHAVLRGRRRAEPAARDRRPGLHPRGRGGGAAPAPGGRAPPPRRALRAPGHPGRPLARDVRAEGGRSPINIGGPVYPVEANREFGAWGLSFASDRWDLRRVLVLEGRVKGQPGFRGESRLTMYVDLQTLVPLYYISYNAKEEPIDIGVFASRWSEDRPDYPRWPDDAKRPV